MIKMIYLLDKRGHY